MVVDNQALVRSGLVALLENDRLEVKAISKGDEDVPRICAERSVDVLITDVELLAVDGIDMIRRVGLVSPHTKVLVIAAAADARVLPALAAGAAGFVLKNVESDAICSAVMLVHLGELVLCAEAAGWLLEQASGAGRSGRGLTQRETEVLRLVAVGTANKGIAELLEVSEKTVRNYISRLCNKLALENRAQMVRYAMHIGITGPVDGPR
jgi:DNA-binding NarL/FixJ family response regulator